MSRRFLSPCARSPDAHVGDAGEFELFERAFGQRVDVGQARRAAQQSRARTHLARARAPRGGSSAARSVRDRCSRSETLWRCRGARAWSRSSRVMSLPLKKIVPLVASVVPGEQVEERRLPRAVRPDHRAQFALRDAEIDVGVGREVPERLPEPVRLENASFRASPSRVERARNAARSFASRRACAIVPTMPAGQEDDRRRRTRRLRSSASSSMLRGEDALEIHDQRRCRPPGRAASARRRRSCRSRTIRCGRCRRSRSGRCRRRARATRRRARSARPRSRTPRAGTRRR